jgi:hypothetical protein
VKAPDRQLGVLAWISAETLISDVEMIWRLMPSSARTRNIFAATPEWFRIPTPTMETLETSSSASTPSAPISFAMASTMSRVLMKSAFPTVKVRSALPSRETFWTMRSTTMFFSSSGPKIFAAIPGTSGTPRIESLASFRS